MSQLFRSGIGTSVSASALPTNIQGWFPLGLAGLISLQSKGLSRVFSNTTAQNHQFFSLLYVQLSHLYMTTGKTIALATQTFVGKMMSLLFNMLGITQLPCLQPSSSGELGYNHLGGWFYLLCNIFGDRHRSWECAWGGISYKPPSLAAHFIAYGINY